jgi:hypothetical protein
MSYKTVEEHNNHFVFHHEKGHEIKIAKKGLSEATINKLKGFATGGEVPQEEADKFNQGFNSQTLGGNSNPKLAQSTVKNPQPKPQAPQPHWDPNNPVVTDPTAQYTSSEPNSTPVPDSSAPTPQEPSFLEGYANTIGNNIKGKLNTLNEAKQILGDTLGKVAGGTGKFVGDVTRAAGLAQAPAPGVKNASEQSDADKLGNDTLIPSPATPEDMNALQEGPTPQGAADSMIGGLQKGFGEERSGIIQEQNALKAQGQMIEPAAKQEADRQQQVAEESHAFMQANHDLVNKTQQAVLNQTLDYNRLWHNAGTGAKIMSAIGLAMGGMGAGVTGGQNQASAMLNSIIDRDVQQQKDDLGRKETVLQSALNEYGNMTQAEDALRLQLEAATRAKIIQAQAANPTAEGVKMQLLGDLDQKMGMRIATMDANRMVMNSSSNGTKPGQLEAAIQTISMTDPERGKDLRERYVPGMGLATTKEDASKVKEAYPKQQAFEALMLKLINIGKQAGITGIWNPQTVALAHSMADQAVNSYRELHDMGVYKNSAANFEAGIMGKNPTQAFANIAYVPKVMSVFQNSQAESQNFYKVRGVNPPPAQKIQQPKQNPPGWTQAGYKR